MTIQVMGSEATEANSQGHLGLDGAQAGPKAAQEEAPGGTERLPVAKVCGGRGCVQAEDL